MEMTVSISEMLTGANNVDEGINRVLKYLGEAFRVSRVYIFETTEDGGYVNNTYEWCAAGIEPMIEHLQNMSLELYGYDRIFKESDEFICPDIETLPEVTRDVLREQDIKAMVQCAIKEHGVFRGFIGFDDCVSIRNDWMADSMESSRLRYVSSLLSMFLLKERSMKKLERMAEQTQYRNALTKNALHTFSFDVTDGYLRQEIEEHDGTRRMESLGLLVPCTYDEHCEAYRKKYAVEIFDEKAERLFSRAGLLSMFLEGQNTENVEYYSRAADRYIRVLVLLGEEDTRKHVYATIICYDVTEAKKKDLEHRRVLCDALAQAERANRAKTTFLNNMSHDIRTPMNAIIGFTSLAAAHLDDREKVSDYLKKIQISSNHLLSLINDILDMSRIESGRVKIEETQVSLHEVINDIQSIVQADVHSSRLSVCFETSGLKDENVWCDRLRLTQVLLNCMSNAIKFTPAGGTICLDVCQLPCSGEGMGRYEFNISDTGIGMRDDFISHIFEPFEREETSTVSGIQGTGLGMSITKNIVDMMGGKISAVSKKGSGSKFTIDLTFRLAKPHLPETFGCKDGEGLDGISILLVEDNAMNREIAQEILTGLGAQVDIAQDGQIAVEKVEGAKPGAYDVILMDVQMPVMDGYEATRKIRSMSVMHSYVPIVAMTANVFEEDRRAAIEAGMDGYIPKPVNVENIVRTVRRVTHMD